MLPSRHPSDGLIEDLKARVALPAPVKLAHIAAEFAAESLRTEPYSLHIGHCQIFLPTSALTG